MMTHVVEGPRVSSGPQPLNMLAWVMQFGIQAILSSCGACRLGVRVGCTCMWDMQVQISQGAVWR